MNDRENEKEIERIRYKVCPRIIGHPTIPVNYIRYDIYEKLMKDYEDLKDKCKWWKFWRTK